MKVGSSTEDARSAIARMEEKLPEYFGVLES